MKKLYILILIGLFFSSCSDLTSPGIDTQNTTQNESFNSSSSTQTAALQSDSDVWVGAYLASYNHYVEPTGNWGNLTTEEIDWDAFTHLFYFSLHAQADGSLSAIKAYRNMSPDRINSIISAGHKAGKPVLFSIGGWGNYDGFSNAIKAGNRESFVNNIISTMQEWGFDGVDIDMEPIKSSDYDNYAAFINELRSAMDKIEVPVASKALISVVTKNHPDLFSRIHDKIDQINLMTYDLSGAWQGWVSWHNSAVYSGGLSFPGNGKPLPSIDQIVKEFINSGIPKSKLGIGIDFYGYVWSGGTGTSTGGTVKPNQSWDTAPVVTDNVHYHKIMDQYYDTGEYHWDDKAKAAYLSIDKAGSANDKFITYDDERSVQAKFDYVREKGLGGTIIWELGGGYRKDEPAGERDNLLQAVKQAMNESSGGYTPTPDTDTTPPAVSIDEPVDQSIVSGTVTIGATASDDSGISNVTLIIDGNQVKSFSSAPYNYSFDTSTHPNHSCSIKVQATDTEGNKSSSTISVTVDNGSDNTSDNTSVGTAVFEESLNTPWINASWNTSVDFNSSQRSHSGSKSIKVSQNKWGAFSLHNGTWGASTDLDPASYNTVEMAVYSPGRDAALSMRLENDNGQTFPKISYGTIPADRWVTVSIPMNKLNPNNQVFHRIDVLETSGTSVVYFVDDLKLLGDKTDSNTGGETYVDIFGDELLNPWINSSWNASVDYHNSERVADGSRSIKVDQKSWGGLSVHNGSWSNSIDLNTSNLKRLEFDVYTGDSDVSFKVAFKSETDTSPSAYKTQSISANGWTHIAIPISELNPANVPVHRLSIMEISGSEKTYYVDNLRFVK